MAGQQCGRYFGSNSRFLGAKTGPKMGTQVLGSNGQPRRISPPSPSNKYEVTLLPVSPIKESETESSDPKEETKKPEVTSIRTVAKIPPKLNPGSSIGGGPISRLQRLPYGLPPPTPPPTAENVPSFMQNFDTQTKIFEEHVQKVAPISKTKKSLDEETLRKQSSSTQLQSSTVQLSE